LKDARANIGVNEVKTIPKHNYLLVSHVACPLDVEQWACEAQIEKDVLRHQNRSIPQIPQVEEIHKLEVVFPLNFINGELRIWGHFAYRLTVIHFVRLVTSSFVEQLNIFKGVVSDLNHRVVEVAVDIDDEASVLHLLVIDPTCLTLHSVY
jgi:hypothetical protein